MGDYNLTIKVDGGTWKRVHLEKKLWGAIDEMDSFTHEGNPQTLQGKVVSTVRIATDIDRYTGPSRDITAMTIPLIAPYLGNNRSNITVIFGAGYEASNVVTYELDSSVGSQLEAGAWKAFDICDDAGKCKGDLGYLIHVDSEGDLTCHP